MIADIFTIATKELKEFFGAYGGRKGIMVFIVPIIIMGVIFPKSVGAHWVESPMALLMTMWITLFLVIPVIADAFAGERERHTLETLLASRLPDTAILLGKVVAAVLQALVFAGITAVVGLITVNITERGNGIILYPPMQIAAGLVLCPLSGLLMGGLGSLISLRATTVRQAHQTMSIGIMVLVFLPMILAPFIGEQTKALFSVLDSTDPQVLFAAVALILMAADIVFLWMAVKRFKRTRLSLD
jgi:ABC-2 type transport system permease protein